VEDGAAVVEEGHTNGSSATLLEQPWQELEGPASPHLGMLRKSSSLQQGGSKLCATSVFFKTDHFCLWCCHSIAVCRCTGEDTGQTEGSETHEASKLYNDFWIALFAKRAPRLQHLV